MKIADSLRCLVVLLVVIANSAAALANDIDAQLEEARALLKRSQVEQAEAIYTQLHGSTNGSPEQRADILAGLATIADMQRDNAALESYAEQALAHAQQHSGLDKQHAHALLLLGIHSANIDDEPESTRHYLQALKITESLPPEQSILPDVLINLAINSTIRDDFAAAEQLLLEALDTVRAGPNAASTETRILANLAYVYGTRNEITRARDVYQEIVDIAREEEPDSLVLANRLSNLGSMERSAGNIDAASTALAEALDIQSRLAPDSLDIARTYYALGEIAESQGQLEPALDHYQHSLTLARAATNGAQITYPLRGVSGVLIKLQRYDDALPLLAEAVDRAAAHTPVGTQHARSLGKLGVLHEQRGDVQSAIAALEQAVEILEIQYSLLGGSAITLAEFSDQFETIYATLAELYLRTDANEKALMILERYRERALLINLDLTDAARARETPEQQALRATSSKLFKQLEQTGETDPEREFLRSRLQLLQQNLNPSRSSNGTAIKARALEVAQKQLRAQDRILFFNIAEDRQVVFLISADDVHVTDLNVSEQQLDDQVRRMRTLLQTPASSEQNLEAVSSELYRMLISPLSDNLPEHGRLFVIPHKMLHLLPFSSLYDPERQQYLLQNHDIVQTGSLSSITSDQQTSTRTSPLFAGFAYSGNDQSTDVRGQPLGQLLGAEQEVQSAADALAIPSRLFTGKTALKSHMSDAALASILHFATHAVIDMDSPRDSYLLLAPEDEDGGQLSLWQIANGPRLSADLVVLSACSTAVGPSYAGEGVLGLSKAFSLAGATGVAASLWPVADDSTKVLMQQFYKGLADDTPAASALRQAQLQLLNDGPGWLARTILGQRDFSHPYYWAPFIINRL